jgi:hypothetical protein
MRGKAPHVPLSQVRLKVKSRVAEIEYDKGVLFTKHEIPEGMEEPLFIKRLRAKLASDFQIRGERRGAIRQISVEDF